MAKKRTSDKANGWKGEVKGARPGIGRLAVYLPLELIRRLKIRVANDDRINLSSAVEAALIEYLK